MKVYTKKNNGLRLLGEGMVYSKKDLLLKEIGGSDKITAFVGKQDAPAETLARDAVTTYNTHKSVLGGVYVPTEAASDGQNQDGKKTVANNMGDSKLVVNPNDPGKVKNSLINGSRLGVEGVEISDSDQSGTNEARKSRKVMDEMRANSVPFTKTELTKFLKSI